MLFMYVGHKMWRNRSYFCMAEENHCLRDSAVLWPVFMATCVQLCLVCTFSCLRQSVPVVPGLFYCSCSWHTWYFNCIRNYICDNLVSIACQAHCLCHHHRLYLYHAVTIENLLGFLLVYSPSKLNRLSCQDLFLKWPVVCQEGFCSLGMWVLIAVRHVANCYTLFAFTFTLLILTCWTKCVCVFSFGLCIYWSCNY